MKMMQSAPGKLPMRWAIDFIPCSTLLLKLDGTQYSWDCMSGKSSKLLKKGKDSNFLLQFSIYKSLFCLYAIVE